MTNAAPATPPNNGDQSSSKFVVFQSFRGRLTLPNGTEYEFREIRPHPVDPSDPRSPVWYEGFAAATNTDRRAADRIIENAFARAGSLPAHLPEGASARPLQLKLNPFPEDKKRADGKSPDYIGSLLTSEGYFTVFARKQDGKAGLLLAGSVATYQSKAAAEAEGPKPPKGRAKSDAKPPADPK